MLAACSAVEFFLYSRANFLFRSAAAKMCNVRKNHIRIAFFVSNISLFKPYAIFAAQVCCPVQTYSLVNSSDGAKDFTRTSPLKNVGAGKNLSQASIRSKPYRKFCRALCACAVVCIWMIKYKSYVGQTIGSRALCRAGLVRLLPCARVCSVCILPCSTTTIKLCLDSPSKSIGHENNLAQEGIRSKRCVE